MPSCLRGRRVGADHRNIQSALSAYEVQIFCPLIDEVVPVEHRARLQARKVEARPGSSTLAPPPPRREDARRWIRFELLACLPAGAAGRSWSSRKPIKGGRTLRRAISWESTFASGLLRPPPPYAFGQVAPSSRLGHPRPATA